MVLTAYSAQSLLLVAVEVVLLTHELVQTVVQVVAVLVVRKQSIVLAVQVTHQAQVHHKVITAEQVLVLPQFI
jgi:hypothetical protein